MEIHFSSSTGNVKENTAPVCGCRPIPALQPAAGFSGFPKSSRNRSSSPAFSNTRKGRGYHTICLFDWEYPSMRRFLLFTIILMRLQGISPAPHALLFSRPSSTHRIRFSRKCSFSRKRQVRNISTPSAAANKNRITTLKAGLINASSTQSSRRITQTRPRLRYCSRTARMENSFSSFLVKQKVYRFIRPPVLSVKN